MSSVPPNEELARCWTLAQPTVAALIAAQFPDYHDAQDVLQEVAVVLVRKFKEYDPHRPFLPWAIGIARNEILAHRRKHSIDRVVFDDEVLDQLAATFRDDGEYLSRFGEALAYCMGRLDGKSGKLIEMRYGQDMKPAEIASRLRATANGVAAALYRIRRALRECADRRLNLTGRATL